MAQKPGIPKGTRDFSPEVMVRREFIFNTLRNTFKKYGYSPIETPSFELLSVLTGKYGEEGDRLIFKILNSGNFFSKRNKQIVFPEDIEKGEKYVSGLITEKALRYDLTVPFARYVVMNQNDITLPFKRYQIQPVWRADRPQKGRYREFFQCDADVVGSDSLIFEAEFIAIYDEAFSTLGLDDFTISVNNRKILSAYAEVIGQEDKFRDVIVAIDKLDKIGEEGVKKELEGRGIDPEGANELFDILSFEGNTQEKLDFLERKFASSSTGLEGVEELRAVFSYYESCQKFNGEVLFDLSLARGLDYYTGTVFEVRVNNVQIGSIGGGGRYADLTGVFGKPGLSGVGISFGADRTYDAMNELGLFKDIDAPSVQAMFVNFGEESLSTILQLLGKVRAKGIPAEVYPDTAKLKKQFGYANKKNIPFVISIGSQEMERNEAVVKHMKSGEQSNISLSDLGNWLASATQ